MRLKGPVVALFAIPAATGAILLQGDKLSGAAPRHPALAVAAACPRNSLTLPPDGLSGAVQSALAAMPALYPGVDLEGALADRASLATSDRRRGQRAKEKCGKRVYERTVVVYLEFPAMRPSASLSQGVVLVTRTLRGYVTWERLH